AAAICPAADPRRSRLLGSKTRAELEVASDSAAPGTGLVAEESVPPASLERFTRSVNRGPFYACLSSRCATGRNKSRAATGTSDRRSSPGNRYPGSARRTDRAATGRVWSSKFQVSSLRL